MADLKRYGRDSLPAEIENPSDNIEIDQIMAKLEQDNNFLADLEKQRADRSKGDSPPHRAASAITDSGFLSQSSDLNGASMSPVTRERAASLNHSALELPGLTGADKINLLSGSFSTSALNNLPGNTVFSSRQEVIVDKDGSVISKEGRGAISGDPAGADFPWYPKPVGTVAQDVSVEIGRASCRERV